MKKQLFFVETVEGPPFVIKIRFESNAPMPDLVARLSTYLEMTLSQDKAHYVIDMENIPFPSVKLIALLVAAAQRARLRNGELKLEKISDTAKNKFKAFTAWSYLVDPPDTAALPVAIASAIPAVAHEEGGANPLAEIAEPPLLLDLDNDLYPATDIKNFGDLTALNLAEAQSFTLRVESSVSKLYQLCDFVIEHAKLAGMNAREIGKIRIAVYEACLNVIEHAYHSNPENWIDLTVQYNSERFLIVIRDTGLSFQMKPQSDYDVQDAVAKRRTGGFGMHIIRRSVDHLEYHPDRINGNRLIMLKNLH